MSSFNKLKSDIISNVISSISNNRFVTYNTIVQSARNIKIEKAVCDLIFPCELNSFVQDVIHLWNAETLKQLPSNFETLRFSQKVKCLLNKKMEIASNKRSFFIAMLKTLSFPQNALIMQENTIKDVNFLLSQAGDTSTNFTFYTKRAVMYSIYIAVMLRFAKNSNVQEFIEKSIDNLKYISVAKQYIADFSLTKVIKKFF
jgi:ubiquinone biosynthesis protein COQ9